ncbi:MAG: V-type ATPase subunit [Anaerolineae bacterium]
MATGLDAIVYAGANARIRGLHSRLLSDALWRDLIHSENLATTLNLLRDTPYRDAILTVEESGSFSLEALERELLGRAATNVRKAMSLTSGGARTLLLVWRQHYELENIKATFRGVEQGMEPENILRYLTPLGGGTGLAWDALLHERTVAGLIERFTGTHYINPLRNAFPVYQRERSLFPIEVALDIRYYRDVAAAIKHLGGADRDAAQRVLGTRLDILNILWAYRYRVYYGLSAEEIVNYTLWHTLRTNTQLIREIALGADPRDVLAQVWGEGAFDLTALDTSNLAGLIPQLELLLQRFWRQRVSREIGGYPFGLGNLLAYIVLQEMEVHDLLTLLEGKSMGWYPQRIDQHLVRREE